MNVQELYAAIGGDYDSAKSRLMSDKIISKFVVKYKNDPSYQELVDAVAAQDEDAIFRASHTLKGVAANLALTGIWQLANEITEAYRPGNDALKAALPLEERMAQLTAIYNNTVEKLNEFEAQA